VLGTIAGWLVRAGRDSASTVDVRSSAGSELRLEITTPATTDPVSLAISPDGTRLAFVASHEGRPQLWIRSLATSVAEPIAGTAGAEAPFWSPDGTALGFFADGQLQRVDLDVGSVRVLAPAIGARGGAWSPEGEILFQPTVQGPLNRVSAQGGPVTGFEEGIGPLRDLVRSHARYQYFLPGGKHFLYWHWWEAGEQGSKPSGIGVASLDGTLRRHLVDDAAGAVYSSGHLLFVKGTTLLAQPFDPASLSISGSPFPVAAGVRIDPKLVAVPLSATATGPIVYRAGAVARRQFVWVDRSGAVLATVGEAMTSAHSPSLSPDGRSIAFDGDGGLSLMDVARGISSRLNTGGMGPLWSTDGKRIVLSGQDVRVVPVAGGDPEVLIQYGRWLSCTDWSADGRLLLCHTFSDDGPGQHLLVMPLNGGEPIQIGGEHSTERDAQFSPDGSWIAYVADDSGPPQVYLQRLGAAATARSAATGPRVQVSSAGGGMPRFRADGSELYYVGLDGRMMAVPLDAARDGEALEAGTPTALFDAGVGAAMPSNSRHQYMVAPDGQRFLLSRLVEEVPPPVTVILNWKPPT
jgi:Tol biopolymer transport system component